MNVRIEYELHPPNHGKNVIMVDLIDNGTNEVLCHCTLHERKSLIRIMGLVTVDGKRRMGYGSKLFQHIVENMDKSKHAAYLEVDAFECTDHQGESTGMNDEQLRYWYGRFGFDDVPGHPFAMVRYPK